MTLVEGGEPRCFCKDNTLKYESACIQDYGFQEGLPFSVYWRGVRAQRVLLAFFTDKIEEALQDREALVGRRSVVSLLLQGLDEEGMITAKTTNRYC